LLAASANEDSTARLSQSIAQIFDLVFAAGGHASLLFAPRAVKERTNPRSKHVVAPASTRLPANSHAELISGLAQMRRLKSAFDPQNIFAPGRFAGGI
jgi:FAD/FMN-containing dehydrogenase